MNESARLLVRTRAGDRCEYCRLPHSAVAFVQFHVDHVIAPQHGGTDDPENLAFACNRCNAFKGTNLAALDSETRMVVRLFDPRNQRWSDHFHQLGFEILGLTAIGRATVQLLNLNAIERVQLREECNLRLDTL